MPSRSKRPEDAPDTILDLLQRVGDEATKLTLDRLGKQEPEPPKDLTPDDQPE
jgi:hypothetical protein